MILLRRISAFCISGRRKSKEAILQSQVFAGQVVLTGRKRRVRARVEDLELITADFNFTGCQLLVGLTLQSVGHLTADRNDALSRYTTGIANQLCTGFRRPDDDLG